MTIISLKISIVEDVYQPRMWKSTQYYGCGTRITKPKMEPPNLVMPKSSHFSHWFPSSASDMPQSPTWAPKKWQLCKFWSQGRKTAGHSWAMNFASHQVPVRVCDLKFLTRLLWGWLNNTQIYSRSMRMFKHMISTICPLVQKIAEKSPNLRGG